MQAKTNPNPGSNARPPALPPSPSPHLPAILHYSLRLLLPAFSSLQKEITRKKRGKRNSCWYGRLLPDWLTAVFKWQHSGCLCDRLQPAGRLSQWGAAGGSGAAEQTDWITASGGCCCCCCSYRKSSSSGNLTRTHAHTHSGLLGPAGGTAHNPRSSQSVRRTKTQAAHLKHTTLWRANSAALHLSLICDLWPKVSRAANSKCLLTDTGQNTAFMK